MLLMSLFDRLTASLGQPHGQPPQTPLADTCSRDDRNTTHVYEQDPYILNDELPRVLDAISPKINDTSLSMSLHAHGPTFTTYNNFSEFRREYINYLGVANNHIFPCLLGGATPLDVVVNTAYRTLQKKPVRVPLRRDETRYYYDNLDGLSARPFLLGSSVTGLGCLA
jgi:hypothetical protein